MRTLAALLFLAISVCWALTIGRVTLTTAGTPVQMVSASTKCVAYTIQAAKGNTGIVYVGSSSAVSSTNYGFLLNANDSVAWTPAGNSSIYDLSTIWLVGSVNADVATWACQ